MTDHPRSDGDPQIDRWSVERLLHGQPADAESGAAAHALAAFIAAARTPATPAELSSEAAVVAAFSEAVSSPASTTRRSRTRRSFMLGIPTLSTLLSSKVALAAAAIGAVSVGGVTTAAYTGSLPTPLQNFAHDTVGAPAAPDDSASAAPKGPDASGSAAFGLCTAYQAGLKKGAADTKSVAFKNLAAAAGGAANIPAYCATITHPGAAASHQPSAPASPHATGKPSAHPSTPAHPTGKPSHGDQPTSSPGAGHRP